MKRCLIWVAVVAVSLLVGAACSFSEQDQGARSTTDEELGTTTIEERTDKESGSDLAELLNDPAYMKVIDNAGGLSVEVPSRWEAITGEDSEEEGSSWSSFGGENVGASITASTDLDAWHNMSGVPGVYIVASRELAQKYTDDQLIASGPNDFSSSCDPGSRQDFDRPPYSGRMQAWNNCGNSSEANLVTLAAAPEGRECVVLLQIVMYGETDVEVGQRILDTFEIDCDLVSVHESELASEASRPAPPNASPPSEDEPDSSELATGVLKKLEITSFQYGTHSITDEASGTFYALKSEDEELLDSYVGQRVTVYGTPMPGYENGQIEGGPPLLNVTRVEPA